MQTTVKTTITLLLACWTFTALPQDKPAPPPTDPKTLSTFDINFPGGTARDLVTAIEKASSQPVNVLIPAELASTTFPRVQFKSVDLQTLFRALDLAQSSRGVSWANVNNVMVLMSRPQSLETGVYYIGNLLTKFKVEDVTTAVQTAWTMAQSDTRSELKYHQDTQLLIVRGPKSYLNVVKDVLSELNQAVPDTTPKIRPAAN